MYDSRSRLWFALFVVAVFCLGGAGGFLIGRHAPSFVMPAGPPFDLRGPDGGGFARGGPAGRRGGPPFGPGPAGLPPEAAARLANELQLDDAQRAQFRKLLDDHRAKFE